MEQERPRCDWGMHPSYHWPPDVQQTLSGQSLTSFHRYSCENKGGHDDDSPTLQKLRRSVFKENTGRHNSVRAHRKFTLVNGLLHLIAANSVSKFVSLPVSWETVREAINCLYLNKTCSGTKQRQHLWQIDVKTKASKLQQYLAADHSNDIKSGRSSLSKSN